MGFSEGHDGEEIGEEFLLNIFRIYEKILMALSEIGIGKIPGVAKIGRLITAKIFYAHLPGRKRPIRVFGGKMYLNRIDTDGVSRSLLLTHVYEKVETALFREVVKEGMVVVDVGANIGYYSLVAARLVGKHGKVYAFEPEANNYALLLKNVEANNYTNVIAIQKAVSDTSGKRTLYLRKMAHDHSFSKENIYDVKARGRSLEVETISLDEFFSQQARGKVNVIKIDAEGAEHLIVKGMNEILTASNELKIFMEFWPYGIRSLDLDPQGTIDLLCNYGFRFTQVDSEKQQITHNINPQRIIEICEGTRQGRGSIDLFLEKEVSPKQ